MRSARLIAREVYHTHAGARRRLDAVGRVVHGEQVDRPRTQARARLQVDCRVGLGALAVAARDHGVETVAQTRLVQHGVDVRGQAGGCQRQPQAARLEAVQRLGCARHHNRRIVDGIPHDVLALAASCDLRAHPHDAAQYHILNLVASTVELTIGGVIQLIAVVGKDTLVYVVPGALALHQHAVHIEDNPCDTPAAHGSTFRTSLYRLQYKMLRL